MDNINSICNELDALGQQKMSDKINKIISADAEIKTARDLITDFDSFLNRDSSNKVQINYRTYDPAASLKKLDVNDYLDQLKHHKDILVQEGTLQEDFANQLFEEAGNVINTRLNLE